MIVVRCTVVWLGATAAVAALARGLEPSIRAACVAGADFETLLVGLCAAALVGCGGWAWLTTSVVVVEAGRAHHGRLRRTMPGIPVPLRRLVLAACGVAVVGGLASPALAAPGPVDLSHLTPTQRVAVHAPLVRAAVARIPDAAPRSGLERSAGQASEQVTASSPEPTPDVVTVRAGDSLWSLAAGELGAAATAPQIAGAWPRIYAANRAVIGPDPDLIVPGEQLRLPH